MIFNTIITLKIWIKHDYLYIAIGKYVKKNLLIQITSVQKIEKKTYSCIFHYMKLWTHLTSSISVHNPAVGKLSAFLALVQFVTSVLSMSDDSLTEQCPHRYFSITVHSSPSLDLSIHLGRFLNSPWRSAEFSCAKSFSGVSYTRSCYESGQFFHFKI